jgi:hypothetical protein
MRHLHVYMAGDEVTESVRIHFAVLAQRHRGLLCANAPAPAPRCVR